MNGVHMDESNETDRPSPISEPHATELEQLYERARQLRERADSCSMEAAALEYQIHIIEQTRDERARKVRESCRRILPSPNFRFG